MLRRTVAAMVVAAFAGVTGLEFAAMPANATMPTGSVPIATKSDPNIQPVAWVYAKGKHGKRFKVKTKGYPYFYGGYYYARPWWTYGAGPNWVYVSKKHGKRFKVKAAGYPYYYGGYYYAKPWWRPGFSVCIGC